MEKIQPADVMKDPIIDLPFGEASRELTWTEVAEIERRYKGAMENLAGRNVIAGTVYALRKRTDEPLSWPEVESMTLSQLKAHFAPDPKSDEDEPGEA